MPMNCGTAANCAVLEVTEVDIQNAKDHDNGNDCGGLITAFHFQRAFIGLERIAGCVRIDAAAHRGRNG